MHFIIVLSVLAGAALTEAALMETQGRHHHQHHTRFRHSHRHHHDVDDEEDQDPTISGNKPDPQAVLAKLSTKTRKAMAKLKKDVLVEKQVHNQFEKELKDLEPLEKSLDEEDDKKDDNDGDDGSSFIQEGAKRGVDDTFAVSLDSTLKKEEQSSSDYQKGLDDWYAGFKKELASFAKDDGDQQSEDDKADETSLAEITSKHATRRKRIKCPQDDDKDSFLQKAGGSGEDNEAQFKAEVEEEEHGEERRKQCEHNARYGIEQDE
ncbi:hypothetical protein FOZ61_001780 [Perkinsus olseni]|uniref:Uncharacterized protein n=1 Tax=Perkinsus olseni TaxID=32597 RepID=A0A7J6LVU3_PEROL|nr:hypothetical protein FOZ61_001780 [Perkinsus olseni]